MKYGSVCSGIEAASVAWEPLGWKASFLSEIDKFPRAVLRHHYPETPLHGDFTTIQAGEYDPIDLLVGGTPCQSFSVAGLRGGLADDRGNLALEYLRLAQRLRPKWLVWENVPGVLSSAGGRDFGSILGGLVELGYGFAYRVLDAQFFGVPQRRRRVFVVGYLGDWRRAAAVLFERDCLSGNPAPRREAGQRPAPTISARTEGGGGLGTDFDLDGGLIARCDTASNQRLDWETETFVTHALRADGFDASEDGTGRGTPIVPVAIQERAVSENLGNGPQGKGYQEHIAYTLEARNKVQAVAFSSKDHGADAGDLAPTLRAMGHSKSHANAGGQLAIAYRTTGNDGCYETGDAVGALTQSTDPNAQIIAFDPTQITSKTNRSNPKSGEPCHTLAKGARPPSIAGSAVRRLTPRECERLQGFPDDYTLITHRKKPAADGPRYKALGNSMAVPVMSWIGRRIQLVEDMPREATHAA